MKKTMIDLPEAMFVGLTVRTNNANERDPSKAKIAATVQRYHQEDMPDQIEDRIRPGVTFCVYTDYESDFAGDYTFFIGEEVEDFEYIPEGFRTLMIPPQSYTRFTTKSGPMPDVVIGAWQNIWKMSPQELEGARSYIADFEVYNERAADPQNTVLDIYVGVEK
ncbi:MAG: GyrI-like domain-containing protein [Pseudomonadota bacterium]